MARTMSPSVRSCPVALLSMFSLFAPGWRLASFPVCGCKISQSYLFDKILHLFFLIFDVSPLFCRLFQLRVRVDSDDRKLAFTIVPDNAGMGGDGLFSAFEVALSMKGDARN